MLVDESRHRIRFLLPTELDRFIENRLAWVIRRGNRFEQIPGAFVVVGYQHAAPAHRTFCHGVADAIETPARYP